MASTWFRRVVLAVLVALAAPACSGTSAPHSSTLPFGPPQEQSTSQHAAVYSTARAPWPRPADQLAQAVAAGLPLFSTEHLKDRHFAHLDLLVDGVTFRVPADLGINARPRGARPPQGFYGVAELNTRDTSGIVYLESANRTFTLSQLFTEWGVRTADGQIGGYTDGQGGVSVTIYVNGRASGHDPSQIELGNHEEVAVIINTRAGEIVRPPKGPWARPQP
jgi:hypothetical protein